MFAMLQLIGGALIVCAVIPQLVRIIVRKSANDFSMFYVGIMLLAIVLMEMYAINLYRTTGEWAFLLTNSLCLVVHFLLSILVYFYRKGEVGWAASITEKRLSK